MATLWDVTARRQLIDRLDQLRADTPPRWGRFTAARMLAHLNDSIRMAAGELAVAPKHLPLRYFPLKQLILYVFPFPKESPTAPELLARTGTAVWEQERAAFPTLVERIIAMPAAGPWVDHPAFGRMSHHAWGVLLHKHIAHHFRQFGI